MEFFLECLGASREIGRSAFLLRTDKKIMLDYGIKIFDESGLPKFPIETINPDFAVLSHAHLDHSGCLPMLYRTNKRIRWYATPPTKDICEILWKDSMKIMGEGLPYKMQHYKKALKYWSPMLYNKKIQTGETSISLKDAGHISGAAMIELEYRGKKILYSGDFKDTETYMHKGARPVKDVDVLILESTYSNRDHPDRKKLEKSFMEEIRATIEDGGNVMLPSFAVGRTQELINFVRNYDNDTPVYVDGMGKDVTNIYLSHPKYLKDAGAFRKAVRNVNIVRSIADKKAATREPSVIITSSGMMNGGPILNYLLYANSRSKIIFTGFCVEGTNGWLLQNKGYIVRDEEELYVDLPVEYMDFSAHAGKSGLMRFIEESNAEKIVLVHGDKPEEFAKELREEHGYDAIAPLPGERLTLH